MSNKILVRAEDSFHLSGIGRVPAKGTIELKPKLAEELIEKGLAKKTTPDEVKKFAADAKKKAAAQNKAKKSAPENKEA